MNKEYPTFKEEHADFMEKLRIKHKRLRYRNKVWFHVGIFLIVVWFIGSVVLQIIHP